MEFLKPDNLNNVWSSGGDRLYPGDTKYANGWGVEIPPRQYFNQIDYKQDQMLAHLNQHGIPVWDNETEYQANKSYVQGTDGIIYKALTTHAGVNPVGDVSGSWQTAFITSDQVVRVATAAQSRAMTDNNVYLSPLQLSNAFTGVGRQSLGQTGFQRLPGGLIMQWGVAIIATTSTGGTSTVTLPTPFLSNFFNVTGNYRNNGVINDSFATNTFVLSLSQFTISLDPTGFNSNVPLGTQTAYWQALGV